MYQRCILEEGDIIEMPLEFEKSTFYKKKNSIFTT
jgi:hypothetical protein